MRVGLIYLFLIGVAELLTATITESLTSVRLGVVLHCVILVALILHGATTRQTPLRRLLLILALSPLIRILSISLPLRYLPLVDWYLIIGSLLFLGSFFTARITGIAYRRLGFTMKNWPAQLAIGFVGIGLGTIEYLILHPKPLIAQPTPGGLLYAASILMIFTGLLEEFIFRGLVQEAAIGTMGRFGILYGAILFAILHVGYLSILDLIFVFAVGFIFGLIVQKTRSLLGVTLAHGLTNITMYLVLPFLIIGFPQPQIEVQPAYQEVLAPRDLSAPILPIGTHFPGRLVTATPDPRTASPNSSVSPAVSETSTPTSTPIRSSSETRSACGPVPAGWVAYIVQPGDSLFGISQTHGVGADQLRRANCLESTVLVRGQRLYVPNAVQQPASLPSPAPLVEPSATFVLEQPTSTEASPTLEVQVETSVTPQ